MQQELLAPTYTKMAEDISVHDLFAKIEQRFSTCFLLESLRPSNSAAKRYSIIGFDPKHHISARDTTLYIDNDSHPSDNPYELLNSMMPPLQETRYYSGGLVGYIGYDAVNYFEPAVNVQSHPDFPAFMFGYYTDGLLYDTYTAELFYFTRDTDRSDIIHELLAKPMDAATPLHVTTQGNTRTKKAHAASVRSIKEHINAGDIFQCETGFKTQFHIEGDTFDIYRRLCQVNPSPYMYYLKFHDDTQLIGASPETLLELRDGTLTARPLAGSIRRGKDTHEDIQLARHLLNNPKEIAEHNMLVDLHRNDIGRVATLGSVAVRRLRDIVRFSHIQHIESEITGRLAPEHDMFSALAANFPAGTLSGAPKIEAMKIIDDSEPDGRGPYGGGVGYFGFNGECDFAIAIRSLFKHGANAYAQTCGGIVYDSDPDAEYDEVTRKLAAMKEVLSS